MARRNQHTVPSARKTGDMRRAPRKSGRERVREQWRASNLPDHAIPALGRKSRIQSVLTALPILMVLLGLFVYYQAEQRQSHGEPVLAEQQRIDARFVRLATVGGEESGQHYLWVHDGERERGVRIDLTHKLQLNGLPDNEVLHAGDAVSLEAAPRIPGSRTLWLLRLWRGEQALLEPSSRQ